MAGSEKSKPMPPEAKRVFKGKIFEVWQWQQKCYDGTFSTFERLRRRDYAYVIGVLPDKRIMLVKDEQPDRHEVLTPAGGGVEDGEDPKDAAAREFLEETGYQPAELVFWHSYSPNSKVEMKTFAFIGRGIEKVREPELEGGERVTPVFYTFEEFVKLGQNPELRDWLLRIKLLEAQIDPEAKANLKEMIYG